MNWGLVLNRMGVAVLKEKTRVAGISVISNTFLTMSKLTVGFFSGSVSILSEGVHSGMDLIAAMIAFFAVRESGKPADERHAYGHGKIENVSGTIEAVLIFVAAIWIIVEAVKKILEGPEVENIGIGIIVMAISALTNIVVSTLLMRTAKKTDSVALKADAMHLRTDVYTSAGVFLGLVLMKFTGWAILDPVIAILVALLIIKAAFDLTKEAFMPLVDVSLPEQEYEVIIEVLQSHAAEFVEYHNVRTRRAGPERHIDLHLVVPKYMPVLQVHELCDRIEEEIEGRLRGSQVLIHAEPCSKRDDPCPTGDEICKKCKVQTPELGRN